MKNPGMIMVAVVLVLAFSSAVLAADGVQIKSKEGLGNYLADDKGMALYYVVTDKGVKGGGCAGPCLDKWPIFYRKSISAPAGLDAKDFGMITRADGKKQSTFRGWPMYTFAGDKAPGDTNGQGVKDIWYVITTTKIQPYF